MKKSWTALGIVAVWLVMISFSASSSAASGFKYRVPIVIEENSGNDLFDYQVKLDINYTSGMKPDFSDVRFFQPITIYELPITINSSRDLEDYQVKLNITENDILSKVTSDARDLRFFTRRTANPYTEVRNKVPYWIEKRTGNELVVWVKTNLTKGNNQIFMYFGNPNVESESNASNVFIIYDNFDDGNFNGWVVCGGHWYVNNGYITSQNWNVNLQWGRQISSSTGFQVYFDGYLENNGDRIYINLKRSFCNTNCGVHGVQLASNSPYLNNAIAVNDYRTGTNDCPGESRGSYSPSYIEHNKWYSYRFTVSWDNASCLYNLNTGDSECNDTLNYSLYNNEPLWLILISRPTRYDNIRVAYYSDPEPTAKLGTSAPISTKEVEIPYWIENYREAGNATIWIKVPFILANSTTKVFMYYGNEYAEYEGNVSNVFEFYDDFNSLEGWDLQEGRFGLPEQKTVDNRTVVELGDNEGIYKRVDIPENFLIEAMEYINPNHGQVFIAVSDKSYQGSNEENGYGFDRYKRADNGQMAHRISKGLNGWWNWGGIAIDYQPIVLGKWVKSISKKFKNKLWYSIEGKNEIYGIDRDTPCHDFKYLDLRNGNSDYSYVDWLRVRKYTTPEPTVELLKPERVVSLNIFTLEPKNGSFLNKSSVRFAFRVEGSVESYNCTIFLNGKDEWGGEVLNATEKSLEVNLGDGIYRWFVSCNGVSSGVNEFEVSLESAAPKPMGRVLVITDSYWKNVLSAASLNYPLIVADEIDEPVEGFIEEYNPSVIYILGSVNGSESLENVYKISYRQVPSLFFSTKKAILVRSKSQGIFASMLANRLNVPVVFENASGYEVYDFNESEIKDRYLKALGDSNYIVISRRDSESSLISGYVAAMNDAWLLLVNTSVFENVREALINEANYLNSKGKLAKSLNYLKDNVAYLLIVGNESEVKRARLAGVLYPAINKSFAASDFGYGLINEDLFTDLSVGRLCCNLREESLQFSKKFLDFDGDALLLGEYRHGKYFDVLALGSGMRQAFVAENILSLQAKTKRLVELRQEDPAGISEIKEVLNILNGKESKDERFEFLEKILERSKLKEEVKRYMIKLLNVVSKLSTFFNFIDTSGDIMRTIFEFKINVSKMLSGDLSAPEHLPVISKTAIEEDARGKNIIAFFGAGNKTGWLIPKKERELLDLIFNPYKGADVVEKSRCSKFLFNEFPFSGKSNIKEDALRNGCWVVSTNGYIDEGAANEGAVNFFLSLASGNTIGKAFMDMVNAPSGKMGFGFYVDKDFVVSLTNERISDSFNRELVGVPEYTPFKEKISLYDIVYRFLPFHSFLATSGVKNDYMIVNGTLFVDNYQSMIYEHAEPVVEVFVREFYLPKNSSVNWISVNASYVNKSIKARVFYSMNRINETEIASECINESDISACIEEKVKENATTAYPWPNESYWHVTQDLLDGRKLVRVFIPAVVYFNDSFASVLENATVFVDYTSPIEMNVETSDIYEGGEERVNVNIFNAGNITNATIFVFLSNGMNESRNLTLDKNETNITFVFSGLERGSYTASVLLVASDFRLGPRESVFNVKERVLSMSGLKKDGERCRNDDECLGGYCVHGYCRSSAYYCGDGYCDLGERCYTCSIDCGICYVKRGLNILAPSLVLAEEGGKGEFEIEVKNSGSSPLFGLKVETNDFAEATPNYIEKLGVGESKGVRINFSGLEAGNYTINIKVYNKFVSEEKEVKVVIKTESVKNVEAPENRSRVARFSPKRKESVGGKAGLFFLRQGSILAAAILLLGGLIFLKIKRKI